MKTTPLALVAIAAFATVPALPAQEFALKEGDRVVFYGDSITQDGRYAQAVEAYVAARFPEWSVQFWNAGVGGDKVSGGWAGNIETRLERDVIARKPTVVTIMLGMNDGGYRAFDPALFETFSQGYRTIVARLKQALPDARLTLLLPSPFDDVTRAPGFAEGYNAVLRKYGAYVQELGQANGATVVDLNAPLVAALEKVNRTNPALARLIIPDRIHPGGAGHLIMAGTLLRAWKAPALVTRVDIETSVAGPRLARAENTEVSGLSAKGPYLEWRETDRALPLPLSFKDSETELAETAGAGLEGLNQQILRITGLASGRYEVVIDAQVVGRFSEAELGAGVNLARDETPMARQAQPLRWHIGDRHEVERVRRQLLAAPGEPKAAEAAAVLDSLDARGQQERQGLAKPALHRYEVRRSYAFR